MKFYELMNKVVYQNMNVAYTCPIDTADFLMNVIRVRNGLSVQKYNVE